ncbi:hypothetical protein LTR08_003490 [Meristemomyces frigidus]|nr:hypothetical protein LTR08_003490 [Meristemomyces frigidus]
MNGHSTPRMGYNQRLEAFRQSDTDRDQMVTEIIRNFEDLSTKYDEMRDDLGNEIESRRMWQSKANTSERALTEQRQASGSNNFALAIIDGDGAIFNDYLYAQGKDGGADAAHLMHTEIRNHLIATYPDSNVSDWSIVVHVVLNLQGLGTKLQSCNIISNPNELTAFGRSFGLAQSLFSFIDVGGGKERADHKVRETLRLFLPNAQCKHVFFGPCNDNGYLPVLEPYRRDALTAARLTLIETTAAEPGFTQLGLKRIRMPQVFRSQPLPSRISSININATPPAQQNPLPIRAPPGLGHRNTSSSAEAVPFVPKIPSPAPSAESGASNSWAAVGKGGVVGKIIDISAKKIPKRRYVVLNAYDERLDPELPAQDSNAYRRFTERLEAHGKCCNNFHLTGKCEAGEYCDYTHGERLTPGEQLVLKHKARSLGCPNKYLCRDPGCFSGHHCRFTAKDCFHDWCRFADTHGMDFEPAKKVYEDGSEEWLASYLDKAR